MFRNADAGAVPTAVDAPAALLSVLYVEDHPVNAMLMAALFERRPGLRLVLAGTGQQALCIAARLNPVLLLLDMRLPDCHGSQLLPLLRQLPGCEHAPAVAVTAEPDFVVEGSGFVELWAKPLHLHHVLQRLDALTAGPPHNTVLTHRPRLVRQPAGTPVAEEMPRRLPLPPFPTGHGERTSFQRNPGDLS